MTMMHRRALFVGVSLAAAGIVMLVGTNDAVAGEAITQALRLWPLAVVAPGVALLLRRTPLAIAGTLVAALLLGGVVGGAVVHGAPSGDGGGHRRRRSWSRPAAGVPVVAPYCPHWLSTWLHAIAGAALPRVVAPYYPHCLSTWLHVIAGVAPGARSVRVTPREGARGGGPAVAVRRWARSGRQPTS